MTYDSWKTTPPDDDPEGEACPDCGRRECACEEPTEAEPPPGATTDAEPEAGGDS